MNKHLFTCAKGIRMVYSRFRQFDKHQEATNRVKSMFVASFDIFKMLYGNPIPKFFLFFCSVLLADSTSYPDQD